MSDFRRFHLAHLDEPFSLGANADDILSHLFPDISLSDFPLASIVLRMVTYISNDYSSIHLEWVDVLATDKPVLSGVFTFDYDPMGYCVLVSWAESTNWTSSKDVLFNPLMCAPELLRFVPQFNQWRASSHDFGYPL